MNGEVCGTVKTVPYPESFIPLIPPQTQIYVSRQQKAPLRFGEVRKPM